MQNILLYIFLVLFSIFILKTVFVRKIENFPGFGPGSGPSPSPRPGSDGASCSSNSQCDNNSCLSSYKKCNCTTNSCTVPGNSCYPYALSNTDDTIVGLCERNNKGEKNTACFQRENCGPNLTCKYITNRNGSVYGSCDN